MTPESFKKAWEHRADAPLSPLHQEKLNNLNLSASTSTFLSQAGLPESAAPFLSFADNSDDIRRLRELYDFLPEEFDHYVVIGSCNEGDPIVINTRTDQVEYMDHEDNFSSRLFNTSIAALADSLLAYRGFVLQVQEEKGEEAYINADYTPEQLQALKDALTRADPEAMARKGFWQEEYDMEEAIWAENKGK